MDYSKQVNKIPYEDYGNLLSSGELLVMKISYADAYTIVIDREGRQWKVTYQQDGFLAVLTKVDE